MERTLGLPDGFMKSYGPKLRAVTLNDVNSALHGFLHPDKLAIVVLATAKDSKAKIAKAPDFRRTRFKWCLTTKNR